MPTLFVLLLKINLVLIIFAAAYYLVLRKLTFYTLNRAFLMLGIFFSSVYPFIDLSSLSDRYQRIATIVPQIDQGVSEYIKQDSIPAYWQMAYILFWTGVFIMASRLVLQFISLYRIHRSSKPGVRSGYNIRILTDDLGPFSFWQTIYINPDLHAKSDLDNILKHEHVHVKEWHTLDIIASEISLAFYWFNPGVWLMKKAVRENIEFITDARILKKGIDKKSYQYSLLHAGHLIPAMAIVNNFNLSDLKKRIKMMNAKRSSPLALSRYLFLLPVLLVSTLAFTISKKDELQKILTSKTEVLTLNSGPDRKQVSVVTLNKKQPTNVKKPRPVISSSQPDTMKRVMIIQAFDNDTGTVHNGLDVLPEPYPGDRIKMIKVRTPLGEIGGGGGFIAPGDTSNGGPKKVFIVLHDGDNAPPPGLMNIRQVKVRSAQFPEGGDNMAIKFFLNGKEISKEEFRKIELMDREGMAAGKKLMIRVEKKE